MRCLVVFAHPDPGSFGAALRDSVVEGLESAGHHVDVVDLYAIDFQPCLTEMEHREYLDVGTAHPDPTIAQQIALLVEAEMLVAVYPTWWSGMPAILKGWLERVFLPDVSFTLGGIGGVIRPNLSNLRHLIGVTTYGSPRPYRLLVGDPGRRTLLRTARFAAGRKCRSDWLSLDRLDGRPESDRTDFLAEVRADMAAR